MSKSEKIRIDFKWADPIRFTITVYAKNPAGEEFILLALLASNLGLPVYSDTQPTIRVSWSSLPGEAIRLGSLLFLTHRIQFFDNIPSEVLVKVKQGIIDAIKKSFFPPLGDDKPNPRMVTCVELHRVNQPPPPLPTYQARIDRNETTITVG